MLNTLYIFHNQIKKINKNKTKFIKNLIEQKILDNYTKKIIAGHSLGYQNHVKTF